MVFLFFAEKMYSPSKTLFHPVSHMKNRNLFSSFDVKLKNVLLYSLGFSFYPEKKKINLLKKRKSFWGFKFKVLWAERWQTLFSSSHVWAASCHSLHSESNVMWDRTWTTGHKVLWYHMWTVTMSTNPINEVWVTLILQCRPNSDDFDGGFWRWLLCRQRQLQG